MTKEEIQEIVREAVKSTLKEIFSKPESDEGENSPRYYRPSNPYRRFDYEVDRLGYYLSRLERKWPSGAAPSCLYEKPVVDAIKTDTAKIP